MKTRSCSASHFVLPALLAFVALWLTGCTTTRVDWNARVGNYTFDQAVTELGPPDKQARLSDASVVAEWISRSSRPYVNGPPVMWDGHYRHGSPWYGGGFVENYTTEYVLRLSFGPEGRLKEWRELTR